MPPRKGPSVTPEVVLAITSLEPDTAEVGSPAATIEVYGTGFDSTCTVEADGQPRNTFFLDAGHLQYTARPDLQTTAQTVQVTVVNGAGGESNSLPFTFTAPPDAGGGGPGTPTIGFWTCDCGLSISASRPVSAAPVCICGRTMYEVTSRAPAVLYNVVWVDRQDQRNR